MREQKFGGLTFGIHEGQFGPWLRHTRDPDTAMSGVLRTLLSGEIPDALNKIKKGENIIQERLSRDARFVVLLETPEGMYDAKEFWKKLTNDEEAELEEGPIYGLSTFFNHEPFYFPQQMLIEILESLLPETQKAYNHAVETIPQPWLFRSKQVADIPGPSEHELLKQLERQAQFLDQASQDSAQYIENNYLGKERTILWEHKKRKEFQEELIKYGLVTESTSWGGFYHPMTPKYTWLQLWKLPLLSSYIRAGAQLRSYLTSQERKAVFSSDSEDGGGLRSCISLDWFREKNPSPANKKDYEWLAWCEKAFCEQSDFSGLHGNFIIQGAHSQICLYWRKEQEDRPKFYTARFVL